LRETGPCTNDLPPLRTGIFWNPPSRAGSSGTIPFLSHSGVLIRSQRKNYGRNVLIKNPLGKRENGLDSFSFLLLPFTVDLPLKRGKNQPAD
jgi:hypothetical protein